MTLIFVAVINYRHLSNLGQSAEQIMARNYRSIKAAQEAANILENNRNVVLSQFFGGGNPDRTTNSSRDLARALETCRLHIAERGENLLVEDLENRNRYLLYSYLTVIPPLSAPSLLI